VTADQPPLRRPAPQQGVFETMLVQNGVPLEVERHLARLSASLAELFGETLPEDARTALADAARDLELGRLRLTVAPVQEGGLGTEIRTAPVEPSLVFPAWDLAATLRRLVVPGGLGAHKWADREPVDRAEQHFGAAVALLVDEDGTVLEGSRGNIFLVARGAILTPSADGRILPGVTRGRVLELASELALEAREAPVTLEQLAAADEAFMTGAVRGVEPVREVVGLRRWQPGKQTLLLADRLRTLWAAEAAA
jgi:para-aminobenzoate synthetase / 4-amino-4-deoxychorismate lyase